MVRAGGDDEGFERWYRAEHGRLVSSLTVMAGSVDAAHDAVADAFAKAYERWDRVAAMESPTGWVRQVAVNGVRRRMRRAALERTLLRRLRPPERQPAPAIEPELWTALRALPERQRAVLALRIVLDLAQEDVARLLAIRPGTVSATLVAARQNLQRLLHEPEGTRHG
jgi:RNA polymerase sigma-70 factor (ECF subfamily)